MQTNRTASWTPAAVAMLALAGAGAISLVTGKAVWTRVQDSDSVSTLLVLAGGALLLWAVVVGGFVGTHLVRQAMSRRSPAWSEVIFFVAAVIVIAVALVAVPPVGSGTSSG